MTPTQDSFDAKVARCRCGLDGLRCRLSPRGLVDRRSPRATAKPRLRRDRRWHETNADPPRKMPMKEFWFSGSGTDRHPADQMRPWTKQIPSHAPASPSMATNQAALRVLLVTIDGHHGG